MKRTSRNPSKLSQSLQRHLNAYALAASAAGVGMLALASPAEAKIVYTKTHRVLGANSKFNLDLNHDQRIDFTISQHFGGARPLSGYGSLLVRPATNESKNQIWGTVSYIIFSQSRHPVLVASALSSGVTVGPNSVKIQAKNDVMWFFDDVVGTCSCGSTIGQWKDVQNKYLGLKFYGKSGRVHYGWARLSVTYWRSATLTGYAYETIPNKPIITGKTKGPDVITLEPGSLGRLAQGSVGRLGESATH